MKIVVVLCIFVIAMFADHAIASSVPMVNNENKITKTSKDSNKTSKNDSNAPIVVEDTSGLTDEEVRSIAKENDKKVKKREELDSAIDALLDGTFNENAQKEKTWSEMSPTPLNYDWIQTKSGEWFKGYIKAMFNKRLEFDSDEINMHTFKFKNVVQIKSYQVVGVNIDKIATFEGIIRLKDDKIRIIQGNNEFEFHRDEVVSFAHSGTSEKDHWYAKASLSLNWRKGNSNQIDYSAQATLKRRTADESLVFDYFGKYSSISGKNTVNDHRINQKYDIYFTKHFYWTPVFSEFYQDEFKNIKLQFTAGTGIGYFFINNDVTEWDITVGPGVLFTNYLSVETNQQDRVSAFSSEFNTRYIHELTKKIDFSYSYKFTFTDKNSGFYKHHMITKLENEITKWLDLDITWVWDYIDEPTHNSDGTIPNKNDNQFLIGLGMEF